MTVKLYVNNVNALIVNFQKGHWGKPEDAPVQAWIKALMELREYLKEQDRLLAVMAPGMGDLSDLPPELLKELGGIDALDTQILTAVRVVGGRANLDQILVNLYRKFEVMQTRRFIQNKCYRLVKKGRLHQVPGERTAFTLEPPKEKGKNTLDDEIPF